jgi:hypothetical protein
MEVTQMKTRILSLALAVLLLAACAPAAFAADPGYSDVPANHWAYDVIETWSGGYGVLEGDGNGHFFPSNGIKLGEFAAILSRSFGYTDRSAADVTPAWADEYVEKAMAAGVLSNAASVDANVTISREEAIRYIALAYAVTPVSGETSFADNALIGAAYKPYVKALQQAGYIQGRTGNLFAPQEAYTRAEAMKVLANSTSEITDTSVEGKTYAASLIVRKAGVTIKNTTVKGNLIVGQGVGDGDVTLDNVKVEGKLVAYGGGSNSIRITGGSQIRYTVSNKTSGEAVNFRIEDGSSVTALEVYPGSSAKISGKVTEVQVDVDATIEIAPDAVIESMVVEGDNVRIRVEKNGVVEVITVNGETGEITVSGVVEKITINGDKVSVTGNGKVGNVTVEEGKTVVEEGKTVTVGTTGTKVTNNTGVSIQTGTGTVITPGATGTTGTTTGTTTGGSTSGGGGTSGGGSTNPPAPPTTDTVQTLEDLRDALNTGSIKTVYVPVFLQNPESDITIPAGKTVIFTQAADPTDTVGIRIRNLRVEGSIVSNVTTAYLNAFGSLSGPGLKANAENGFFGTDTGYTTIAWVWRTEADGVDTTGWWPDDAVVSSQAALTEATAVSTVTRLAFEGDFSVTESFSISDNMTLFGDCDITIANGVTVEARVTLMNSRARLTVNGTMDVSRIQLYGDSQLTLGGTTYKGPRTDYFGSAVARILEWDSAAGEWVGPFLINTNTGEFALYASGIKSPDDLGDITELADEYPELVGVHFYGYQDGYGGFSTDTTFAETRLEHRLHGNQTFLDEAGDPDLCPAMTVAAGVTLTIKTGVTVDFVSDADELALEGVDNTSKIVIESDATVTEYAGSERVWEPGTYIWDADTSSWVLEPAPAPVEP